MAISARAVGSWAAANATTQTVTLPTHQTGDMLLVRVAFKHATMPTTVTCDTSGWAKVGQYNSGTNASGNGTGSVIVAVFWKEATSASETNPTITYHASVAATPSAAVAVSYQKGASEAWATPVGAGGAGGSTTSISGTVGSHISTTAGDMVDFFLSQCDNNTLSVPNVTQTGVTFGTVAEYPATHGSFTDSNDIDADGGYRLASSGTSSAAAVVTGTSTAGDESAVWTTRLRVLSVTTYNGSFTADANIKATIEGSFSANANIKVNDIPGSFNANANIKVNDIPGSFTANAYIATTTSGNFAANSHIARTFHNTIWEGHYTHNDSHFDIYGTRKAAQTFQSSETMVVDFVDLGLHYVGVPPASINYQIQATTAGEPNGTVIGEGNVSSGDFGGLEDTVYRFSITPSAVLQANTTYALVLFCPEEDGSVGNCFRWNFDSTVADYANGQKLVNLGSWAPSPTQDFVFGLVGGTPFTADAYIKATLSGSFVADAYIQNTIQDSFTADATIAATYSGSFTADANIKGTVAGSFSADAYIALRVSDTFNANALIEPAYGSWSETHTTKVVVIYTGNFTADAYIKQTTSGSFTADAYISKTDNAGSFSADAYIKKTDIPGSFTADAEIQGAATYTGNFTADAHISATVSGSFTADAYILATASGTFAADAYIAKTTSDTFVAYANIAKTSEGSFTADGHIKATVSGSFTADANIKSTVSGSFTADAQISTTNTISGSFSADAYIKNTMAGSFVADAYIRKADNLGSFAADAYIRRADNAGSFNANANIKATVAGSFAADAYIKNTLSGSFVADAYIKNTLPGSFAADAYIKRVDNAGSFSANAYIRTTTAGSFDANANIKATVSGSFTADAEIVTLGTILGSFTAYAYIKNTLSGTFAADAYIRRADNAGSFNANAYIKTTSEANFTADANIKATVAGSFAADAYIKKESQGSFTANAYLLSTIGGSFTADGHIKSTVSGTITASAYIINPYLTKAVLSEVAILRTYSVYLSVEISLTSEAEVVPTFESETEFI